LRALHDLIESGALPQPRRTLHFIWPDEFDGTYEFLRRDPGLVQRLAVNIKEIQGSSSGWPSTSTWTW
jgi:hypothetical protein